MAVPPWLGKAVSCTGRLFVRLFPARRACCYHCLQLPEPGVMQPACCWPCSAPKAVDVLSWAALGFKLTDLSSFFAVCPLQTHLGRSGWCWAQCWSSSSSVGLLAVLLALAVCLNCRPHRLSSAVWGLRGGAVTQAVGVAAA